MAEKRMFSKQIVDTDAFLEMPASSQLLYFHLSMRADDEGFVGSPKKIMRMCGFGDDDLKVLIAKRFLLAFESGVVVIKHWLIHNTIRMDRYNPTSYQKEKEMLVVCENKAYTEQKERLATNWQPDDNHLEPQVKLSKVNLSKVSISNLAVAEKIPINHLIKLFEQINPSYEKLYKNKNQRSALERLVKKYGEPNVDGLIKYLKVMNEDRYAKGKSITPIDLENNLAHINNHYKQKTNKPNRITL